MSIGKRILETRKAAGLTQQDVADILRVKKQTIYKYEKDEIKNIPTENISKMAGLFGVSFGYLMGWLDQKDMELFKNVIHDTRKDKPYDEAELIPEEQALNSLIAEHNISIQKFTASGEVTNYYLNFGDGFIRLTKEQIENLLKRIKDFALREVINLFDEGTEKWRQKTFRLDQ